MNGPHRLSIAGLCVQRFGTARTARLAGATQGEGTVLFTPLGLGARIGQGVPEELQKKFVPPSAHMGPPDAGPERCPLAFTVLPALFTTETAPKDSSGLHVKVQEGKGVGVVSPSVGCCADQLDEEQREWVDEWEGGCLEDFDFTIWGTKDVVGAW